MERLNRRTENVGAEGWRCVCTFPDGTVETSIWLTQDGADQMADETEQQGRRDHLPVVCEVTP
jgi:hypothetical protein